MALEVKQTMRLAQQLVVTPQLQQAIKLLQLSRLELANLIQQELQENPVLEEEALEGENEEEAEAPEDSRGELHEKAKEEDKGHEHSVDEVGATDGQMKEPLNFDWENYIGIYNAPGGSFERTGAEDETPSYEATLTRTESLQEHLLWQLGFQNMSEEEHQIATEVVGNINDDGYLQIGLDEIASKMNLPIDHVEKVLKTIQDLDPLGVGARDLKECLLLQCYRLGSQESRALAHVIQDHLEDLLKHDYKQIAKGLGITVEKAEELAKAIHNFDPKPGRPYSQDQPQYITPDVFIYKMDNNYTIVLNEDGLPKLTISPLYRRTLMQGSEASEPTKTYVQEKLRAALWLIKSIHQRQRTLYKVTQSIVKFQKEFLDSGVESLKPLTLKTVAEDIGMHESTISRVTTNKYAHTPRGLFELKYFFDSSVMKTDGGGVASEAVKKQIQKIIQSEAAGKPLSDQQISKILIDQFHIEIARRTVAKYREALGILSSSQRRVSS